MIINLCLIYRWFCAILLYLQKVEKWVDCFFLLILEGAVAQSVVRATPGEEVPGSIPAVAARPLLVGSVSV